VRMPSSGANAAAVMRCGRCSSEPPAFRRFFSRIILFLAYEAAAINQSIKNHTVNTLDLDGWIMSESERDLESFSLEYTSDSSLRIERLARIAYLNHRTSKALLSKHSLIDITACEHLLRVVFLLRLSMLLLNRISHEMLARARVWRQQARATTRAVRGSKLLSVTESCILVS